MQEEARGRRAGGDRRGSGRGRRRLPRAARHGPVQARRQQEQRGGGGQRGAEARRTLLGPAAQQPVGNVPEDRQHDDERGRGDVGRPDGRPPLQRQRRPHETGHQRHQHGVHSQVGREAQDEAQQEMPRRLALVELDPDAVPEVEEERQEHDARVPVADAHPAYRDLQRVRHLELHLLIEGRQRRLLRCVFGDQADGPHELGNAGVEQWPVSLVEALSPVDAEARGLLVDMGQLVHPLAPYLAKHRARRDN
mmetsp:Transcript_122956/g.330305  ORF Transcript_122956/g.330305 Transcript_122956/m.330305 type:complete len:251 (-) Transcript_122956:880-1632(-)